MCGKNVGIFFKLSFYPRGIGKEFVHVLADQSQTVASTARRITKELVESAVFHGDVHIGNFILDRLLHERNNFLDGPFSFCDRDKHHMKVRVVCRRCSETCVRAASDRGDKILNLRHLPSHYFFRELRFFLCPLKIVCLRKFQCHVKIIVVGGRQKCNSK